MGEALTNQDKIGKVAQDCPCWRETVKALCIPYTSDTRTKFDLKNLETSIEKCAHERCVDLKTFFGGRGEESPWTGC